MAENNSFAPSGGASRQDNKYLMDGVDITNPGFGYLSSEVNDLDIAEFNVKKGAITAEFGRAAGFVTNAVSKSGTNQFRGTGKVELRPTSFNADSKTLNSAGQIIDTPSTTDRYLAGFNVGGPIMKDHLFGYASGQYPEREDDGPDECTRTCPRQHGQDQGDLRQGHRAAQREHVHQRELPLPPEHL